MISDVVLLDMVPITKECSLMLSYAVPITMECALMLSCAVPATDVVPFCAVDAVENSADDCGCGRITFQAVPRHES